jgi:predicted esterase
MRVLVLHGYGQNANTMRLCMAPLVQKLKHHGVQFHFMDAKFNASSRPGRQDRKCWWPWVRDANGHVSPQLTKTYDGLEKSRAIVAEAWRTSDAPFQCVLGFSQGAMLADTLNTSDLPILVGKVIVASPEPWCPNALALRAAADTVPKLFVVHAQDRPIADSMMKAANNSRDSLFVATNSDNEGGTTIEPHAVPVSARFEGRLLSFLQQVCHKT